MDIILFTQMHSRHWHSSFSHALWHCWPLLLAHPAMQALGIHLVLEMKITISIFALMKMVLYNKIAWDIPMHRIED